VCVCVWMQLSEMATELEDERELATSRLTELEKLQQDHQEAVKEIESLKMDVRDSDCHCKICTDSFCSLAQNLSSDSTILICPECVYDLLNLLFVVYLLWIVQFVVGLLGL